MLGAHRSLYTSDECVGIISRFKTFPCECLAGMQSKVAIRPEVVDDLFRDIHILALIPASFHNFFSVWNRSWTKR